jgi:hypothetical protein
MAYHLDLPQNTQDELFEDHKQHTTRARNGWRALEKHPIMNNGKVKTKRQYDLGGATSNHDVFTSDSGEPLRVDQVIRAEAVKGFPG